MNDAKILFIVEGEKDEKRLYNHISNSFSLSSHSFSVCGNIHMIYKKIKELDFNVNIVDFLLSLPETTQKDKDMIKKERPFTFIYLIFDYDPQHFDLSKKENVNRGLSDIKEMISFFNNETDPTIGKLYINYPMFESFRDCKLLKPSSFKRRKVRLKRCSKYKRIVGRRGFQINISKLTTSDFLNLIAMNISKANYISTKKYSKPSYKEYLTIASQEKIYGSEKEKITKKKCVHVIHSGLFFVVDYLGNDFYKSIEWNKKT